jgi:dolichol-phosphate mannosyltransferase
MTTGDPVSRVAGDRPTLRTLVIIPTYNERENLPLILQRLHKARPEVHALVVDDNSPDGTGQLAEELASANPDRIHVMHRTVKDGLGAAYLAGFAVAALGAVLDGQHLRAAGPGHRHPRHHRRLPGLSS